MEVITARQNLKEKTSQGPVASIRQVIYKREGLQLIVSSVTRV